MSSLQKLFISPANSVSCRSCGQGVTVRWKHFIALLAPLILLLVLMKRLELMPLEILLVALPAAIVAGFVQLRYLPLVRDRF